MTARWQPIILSLCLFLVGVVLVLLYHVNPAAAWWFPHCPFHSLTGLDCPGCGSMRGLHCLLRGDLSGAANYNLLLLPAVSMLVIGFYFKITGRAGRLWQYLNRPTLVLVTVILFWVLRNIPFYPFAWLSAGH